MSGAVSVFLFSSFFFFSLVSFPSFSNVRIRDPDHVGESKRRKEEEREKKKEKTEGKDSKTKEEQGVKLNQPPKASAAGHMLVLVFYSFILLYFCLLLYSHNLPTISFIGYFSCKH